MIRQTDNLYVTNHHQVTVLQIDSAGPFDLPLAVGIASTITVAAIVVVAMRGRKTKRSSRNVIASGEKLDVLFSQRQRDPS